MSDLYYVIRISPSALNSYLGQPSDEDDEFHLERTTDLGRTVIFKRFVDARKELRTVAKAFPEVQFKLDVVTIESGGTA